MNSGLKGKWLANPVAPSADSSSNSGRVVDDLSLVRCTCVSFDIHSKVAVDPSSDM